MSWGDCGKDSKGRPIGYVFNATCDHPGCNAVIDRGLSFACGGMHGEDVVGCENYFCSEHLRTSVEDSQGDIVTVCDECKAELAECEDWQYDNADDLFKPKGDK